MHHGFGVAARQSHEGFARGVVIGHLGTGNILGLVGTGRADLHGDRLILQRLEVGILGGVFLANEHGKAGRVVRSREVYSLGTFFGDGDACGHHIDHAHTQSGNQRVKTHVDDFDVIAGLIGNGTNEVNVVTHEFAGLGVHKFKGSERGLGAHAKLVASQGIIGRRDRERCDCADAQEQFFKNHVSSG